MQVSRRQWWLAVPVLLFLSLIPSLVTGFGVDADSFSNAKAGDTLWHTGHYVPSRLPGTPLYEFVLALVTPWAGHYGSNLLSLLAFFFCIAAFRRIAQGHPHEDILTLLFACTPVLLVNAVTTMDYVPGLAVLLAGFALARGNKPVAAAVLVGLSVGFRLTYAVAVPALAVFLLARRTSFRKTAAFAALAAAIGLAFYIPAMAQYGSRVFAVPPTPIDVRSTVLRTFYNGLMLFGPLATAGLIVFVIASQRAVSSDIVRNVRQRSPEFLAELSALVLFAGLYIIHSDETAYLIPAIPFFYLLISRWFTRRQLLVCLILIISAAFVTVEFKGGESGRRKIAPRFAPGVIVSDYLLRRDIEGVREASYRYPWKDKTLVMTGMGDILTYRNPYLATVPLSSIVPLPAGAGDMDIAQLKGRPVYFVYALPRACAELLQADGYSLYVFSESAPTTLINKYGYSPESLGIPVLPVFGPEAFYRKRSGHG